MIHIVCAHDAKLIAEMLTRLLEAEQHRVRLTYGRQAFDILDEVRQERSAVLLIWSPNARSQTYMIEWGNKIPAWRLVEIARTPDVQRTNRKSPVIDFTQWKGERGGRAWDALNARLDAIDRIINPPKPVSKPAIAAMLVLAIAAMFGAVTERNRTVQTAETPTEPAPVETAAIGAGTERGGPISTVEPGDLNELHFRHVPDAPLLDASGGYTLAAIADEPLPTIRNATLIEQLGDTFNNLNPLRARTEAAPTPDAPSS